jgi:hypothetical protein
MRRLRVVVVLSVLAVLWPAVAKAQQPRGRVGQDERDQRVARVINDCEQRTNEFLRAVERAWGPDRHNGDELDRSAARLEQALNRIRNSWDRNHDYRRTRSNVGAAIDASRRVNRILSHHRLGPRVEQEWRAIRNELDNLAEVFEQSRIRW